MNKLVLNRQAGVGHLGLILGVVVLLGIGGVGYFVLTKNKSNGSSGGASNAVVDAVKNATCNYDDDDLCKFHKGFAAQEYFTMAGTSSDAEGNSGTMLLQWQEGKSYFKMSGGGLDWEMMSIGDANYTKASDGTWWKQASTDASDDDITTDDYKPDLDEPTDNAAVAARYKQIGKEACGDMTCFKYQEIDPDDSSAMNYFWFDDEEYLLRKYRTEAEGTVSEMTASYSKFNLSEPSPVQELQEGQYIFPGAAGPTSL